MTDPICPYCNQPAVFLPNSAEVYRGRDYGPIWICRPCQAWVGCHKPGDVPLGRLANATLRRRKMEAHAAFDPLWKNGSMTRSDAYRWLSQAMGVTEAHIGQMDVDECRRVIELCKERMKPV